MKFVAFLFVTLFTHFAAVNADVKIKCACAHELDCFAALDEYLIYNQMVSIAGRVWAKRDANYKGGCRRELTGLRGGAEEELDMTFEDSMNHRQLWVNDSCASGQKYMCALFGGRRRALEGEQGEGEERERGLWWGGWYNPPTTAAPPAASSGGDCTVSQTVIDGLKENKYTGRTGSKTGSVFEFYKALGITQFGASEEACLSCIQCEIRWDYCGTGANW